MLLKKYLIPLFFVCLTFFLFYLQSPFIYGGDSSEFSYVAESLTVAHPPGYPFYSFLLYIVTRVVPWGTIPWKAAIISSVSTVLATYFIYKILDELLKKRNWAFFLSLFYLGLFPIMLYGLIPEVFALNNALLAGTTYAFLLYRRTKKVHLLYFIAFFMGLMATHHQIFIFFLPGWFVLSGIRIRSLGVKKVLICVLLACLGFSFYIVPFISYSFLTKIPQWLNLSTLDGIKQLVLRTPYGSLKAYHGATPFIYSQFTALLGTFTFIVTDFKLLGIFFIVLGLFRAPHFSKPFARFLIITLVIQTFFIFYANFLIHDTFNLATFERFLIFIYLNLIFALAIGLFSFVLLSKKWLERYIKTHTGKKLMQISLIGFVVLFFFLFSYATWYKLPRLRTYSQFSQFSHEVLDTLPPNAVLSTLSDLPYFTTLYAYHVENYRPDVKLFSYGFLNFPYYADRVREYYPDLTISKKNSLQTFVPNNPKNPFIAENPYKFGYWSPYGLFWKHYFTEEAKKTDMQNVIRINKHLWEKVYHIPQLDKTDKDYLFLYELRNYYLFAYVRYSEFLIEQMQFKEAKHVLDTIKNKHDSSYMPMKVAYMDLYVKQKDCTMAKKQRDIITEEELQTYPDYIAAEKQYQKICSGQ